MDDVSKENNVLILAHALICTCTNTCTTNRLSIITIANGHQHFSGLNLTFTY